METKRQRQASELIKRNFSMVLQQEGTYIYGDALVTVTRVELSPDLGLASIFVSVYNADPKENVIAQLETEHHRLKQGLASRVRKHMRRMPEIRFFLDETLDEMYRLNELFDELHAKGEMGEEE